VRITANALHTQDEMDRLVDAMVQVRESMYAASKSA
jgi:glycine C-acetyltransferase